MGDCIKKPIKINFTRFTFSILGVILSGILVSFSFPPFNIWPFILVAWMPLLPVVSAGSPRKAFYLGMLQGMIAYGVSLSWFDNIFGFACIPLFGILAFFTGLFCLLFNLFSKKAGSRILFVIFSAALWTSIEYYRSEWFFLRFPWITPGVALGPTWLSPFIGVYGTSFFVFMVSASFLYKETRRVGIFLGLALLSLGIFRPGIVHPSEKEGIKVAAVQREDCFIEDYIKLTEQKIKENCDLIVWPEYAVPYDVRNSGKDLDTVINICERKGTVLVFGTKTVTGKGERDWRNTALVVDKDGVIGEYYKMRPVHFFDDGIPGKSYKPIPTRLGAMGVSICFDCDYTEIMRRITLQGAEFFSAPSFDAVGWSERQHLQHAKLFRIRAAENGRWIVCAASSGVSQVIDPHGNVQESLSPMKDGVIKGSIERRTQLTFYTEWGWVFPWILIFISLVFIVKGVKSRFIVDR
jgi:apolipoprotein N-acyltransferase